MQVIGKLTVDGGLIIGGPAEFKADTLFEKLVTFVSNVIFKGDVSFEGRPTFNKDTAGFALIKEGGKQVRVSFEKEYSETPVVTANSIWDISEEDLSVLTQKEIYLLQKQDFVIAAATSKGFTILLEEPAIVDLKFSWTAIAVKDPSTFSSGQASTTTMPSPTPTVIPITLTPTIAPAIEDSSPSAILTLEE
jgi:hypothetical protein